MQTHWKYVVYRDDTGAEQLRFFEPSTIHAAFVAQEDIPVERLISAGFATEEGECFGGSNSLNLKSRRDADTALGSS